MSQKINIAIDGHSACGKSTTAKELARMLGYSYIDSGAMYRAVTLYFLDHNIDLSNEESVNQALANVSISFGLNADNETETYLNGERVEDSIRGMRIGERVSEVSAISSVRRAMVEQQQKLSEEKGVVMDGRDIGSVVLPTAELKLFMTADSDIRAERRQKELTSKGHQVTFEEVLESLKKRDLMDSTREDSPLITPEDAVVVDTSHLSFEEQLNECLVLANSRMDKAKEEINGS